MNDIRIEADGIAFSYGEPRVLSNISLSVEAGELFACVGPSGAGKSTLLRVIAGLEQPSTGRILINGVDVNDIASAERSVGMVFQNFALWPHMTVFENIAFGASPRSASGSRFFSTCARRLRACSNGHDRASRARDSRF